MINRARRQVNIYIRFYVGLIDIFIAEKPSVEPEKAAPQQQLKPSRSQTSSSSSSSTLMKGMGRSTTSNRVNLSSDVLKVKFHLFSSHHILSVDLLN